MNPATLEAASAAVEKLAVQIAGLPELCGLGVAVLDDGFAIKVNVSAFPAAKLPDDVDGVPVIVDIVGTIRPL